MSLLQSLALVGLVASPAAAFWRLPCKAPVVVQRADPIVNPGALSGHLHTIMGGNAFAMNMDYNTTQSSDCTSCTVHGDLSNYWTPTLYYQHQNGTFQQVDQIGGALVYYLQRKGSKDEKLEAFPEGFRMIAGNPFKRSGGDDFASQAISYNCLNYKGPAKPETGGFPNYNCPNGLRSQVFFPSCWDGKNLDSEDHKSHMAYPIQAYNSGSCPDSHPRHLISIFYEIIWDTDKFANMWYGNSQPFVWSMGDPTGYGYHGDFLNGWNVDILQRAVDECTNDSGRVEDCHVFDLYDDKVASQCTKPSNIEEDLDFLKVLPGCNPVVDGPGLASVSKVDCSAPPNIIGGGSGGSGSNDNAGSNDGDTNDPPAEVPSDSSAAIPLPIPTTPVVELPPAPAPTTTKAQAQTTSTRKHNNNTTKTKSTTKVTNGGGKYQTAKPTPSADCPNAAVEPVTVTKTVVQTVYGTPTPGLNPGLPRLHKHKRHHIGGRHANTL